MFIVEGLRPTPSVTPIATERELAVLTALATTGNMKMAARALRISRRTAYARLQRLCRRLGVETPIQAAYIVWVESVPLSRTKPAQASAGPPI